jgi:hypothetical protein
VKRPQTIGRRARGFDFSFLIAVQGLIMGGPCHVWEEGVE